MPKVKKIRKHNSPHFLWSMLFLVVTIVMYAYAVWMSMVINNPNIYLWVALAGSIASFLLVAHEKSAGKLGKNKFLWSIFSAAFTFAVSIYLAANYPVFVTVIPLITIFAALVLLVYEKHHI